jgi:uncharacterized protein (DUF1330 family)
MTYPVTTIKAIKDDDVFQQYARLAKPLIERHGGRYLAINRTPEIQAGEWRFVRTVIVGFPSLASARAWYDSPEYCELIPLRDQVLDVNMVFVSDRTELPAKGYPLAKEDGAAEQ